MSNGIRFDRLEKLATFVEMGGPPGHSVDLLASRLGFKTGRGSQIARWNDVPGRTQAEVLAVLRGAA